MTGTDQIAVVIPVRNGATMLPDAIESVHGQTVSVSEVIVVDDGSTDDSADIAEALHARCLRMARSGLSAARNTGIVATTTPLIAFLDSDDVWLPTKLEQQLDALASSPALDFVSTRLRVSYEPSSPRPSWLEGLEDGAIISGGLGSTLLVRRDALDTVGYFDVALPGTEDLDWFLRARDIGLCGIELPQPLVEYRLHGGNMTYSECPNARQQRTLDALQRSLKRRRTETTKGVARREPL